MFLQGLEVVLAGVGRGSCRGWKRFLHGLEEVLAEGWNRFLQGLEEVLAGAGRGSCRGWKRFLQGLKEIQDGVGTGSSWGFLGFMSKIGKMSILVCFMSWVFFHGRHSCRVWG